MTIAIANVQHIGFVQCPDCKGWYDPIENRGCTISEGRTFLTARVVCINCAELAGWKQCADCNEVYDPSDLTDCNDRLLCDTCRDAAGWAACEGCDNFFHRDNLQAGADSDDYCESCWGDTFDTCSDCGDTCYRDSMRIRHDELVCDACASRRGGDDSFDPAGFVGCDSYVKITSRRKFGIELETDSCDSFEDLDGHHAWGAKNDCSVSGKEMYSDILYGDAGIDAIMELCDFADSNGWTVNSQCGYHAHFDMRGETTESMKSIALAYVLSYDVWRDLVNSDRPSNRYCRKHCDTPAGIYAITNWRQYAQCSDRYYWINFAAYYVHNTFEVRLYQGTLDGREVCNWIRAHTAFMDWASKAGWAKVRNSLLCVDITGRFDCIAKVWREAGYDDLANYYLRKARRNRAVWAADMVPVE